MTKGLFTKLAKNYVSAGTDMFHALTSLIKQVSYQHGVDTSLDIDCMFAASLAIYRFVGRPDYSTVFIDTK